METQVSSSTKNYLFYKALIFLFLFQFIKTISFAVPAGTPINPFPANGSIDVSPNDLVLTWSNETGYYVMSYWHDIYLGTDSTAVENLQSSTRVYSQNYSVGILTSNQAYYWKIISYISENTTTYSYTTGSLWTFTTQTAQVPSLPINPFPPPGTIGVKTTGITLSWQRLSGTDPVIGFQIYLSEDSAEVSNILSQSLLTTTNAYSTFSLTLDPLTTYYWRVLAYNSVGTTNGTIWNFKTKISDINGPITDNPFPPNNSINIDTAIPAFTWVTDPTSDTVTHYDLYLSTDSALVLSHHTTAFRGVRTIPRYDLPVAYYLPYLSAGSTYWWQIISHGFLGNTYTPLWKFQTIGSGSLSDSSTIPPSDDTTITFSDTSVSLDFSSGTSGSGGSISIALYTIGYIPSNMDTTKILPLEWTINSDMSDFTTNLTFEYSTTDIPVGIQETTLTVYKSTDNGTTYQAIGGNVDTTNHTITVSNVTSFSKWIIGGENIILELKDWIKYSALRNSLIPLDTYIKQ